MLEGRPDAAKASAIDYTKRLLEKDTRLIPEFGARLVARNMGSLHTLWALMSADSRILLLNRAGCDYTQYGERWSDLPSADRLAVNRALHSMLALLESLGLDYFNP